MVAYALLGFRVQQSVLFPCTVNDVGNNFVDDIIKKWLTQEAVTMCEHIINIVAISLFLLVHVRYCYA